MPIDYTKEELKEFWHGISNHLADLRSSQEWKYNENIADQILWLERLQRKVIDDIERKDF